ncbi:WDR48-like protein [Mya arenaria]|uniref:WDR48-like protein n=1 Tax=Mya arenaria TaxID=6604 RepID=A0ABY7F418_MYAAR|nr:WDR48-like protein [Mya arenaria]
MTSNNNTQMASQQRSSTGNWGMAKKKVQTVLRRARLHHPDMEHIKSNQQRSICSFYGASHRLVISASSDTTVKVWNAHKGFCMSTLRTHKDYVKALAYARDKEQVASAGLDRSIFLWDVNTLTALTASNNTSGNEPCGHSDSFGLHREGFTGVGPALLCKTNEAKGTHRQRECISGSSDGTIRLWSLGQQRCIATFRVHDDAANDSFTMVYSGGRDRRVWATDIRNPDSRCCICEEKDHILKLELTQSEPQSLWVSTSNSSIKNYAQKVEDLGKKDLEEEIKNRFKMVHVPNWFSVDLKTGMLTIHLEEQDCFSAWVSAKELGALLDCWPKTHIFEMQDSMNGNENEGHPGSYFQVPMHTPVIFSEVGRGKTLFRLLCRDAGGESEQMLLNENNNSPKSNKLPDRLSASDMIQVRKVIEHVYEKVLGQGSDTGSQGPGNGASGDRHDEGEDISAIAEEKVELLCNEQVLNPNMDLRTVKHFIWKQGGDLTLHYRPLK